MIKRMLKSVLPKRAQVALIRFSYRVLGVKYKYMGRPRTQAETSKAKGRREREGFFNLYCVGQGLDVGYGGDPITEQCDLWDFENGNAQFLKDIEDQSYDFVYSSHTIEHMVYPDVALKNWWRVIKAGGFLLLYLPHRDLYEKNKTLPSRWNFDHKHFFLPDQDEPPDTIGMRSLIGRALPDAEIIYIRECSEGHTMTDPNIQSDGEFSIEVVVKKPSASR